MAGMFEFAGILLLQRRNRTAKGNKVTTHGQTGSFEMDELTKKVDMISLTWFSLSYIVFNVAYWTVHFTRFEQFS